MSSYDRLFLSLMHAEGLVPGVVRLIRAEEVLMDSNVNTSKCTRGQGFRTWTNQRSALADSRLGLEFAESVNDILMVFYDLLEVHRTVSGEHRILYRDISLHNVLMNPTARRCAHAFWDQDFSPLIDDVLQSRMAAAKTRTARCLLIDYDSGALLAESNKNSEQLKKRTGTPVYMARAASARRVIVGTRHYRKMPMLSGEAKSLYIAAYGKDRFERYNDVENTFHGGTKFADDDEFNRQADSDLPFSHQREHDAESVFWTMYALLLRVLPRDGVEDETTESSLEVDWTELTSHSIPDKRFQERADRREWLMTRSNKSFRRAFLPVMHGVATLLNNIAWQVGPSYPLMETPPPHDDHLHEAMQRLILDYLVQHRDDPIPLTPGVLRATAQHPPSNSSDEGHTWGGYTPPTSVAKAANVAQSIPTLTNKLETEK